MDDRLQQQRLGGGIPKSATISKAVGHDSKGARKNGSNGAGPGRNLQGGGAVCDVIWKREMVGDYLYTQGPDGVPPSGGATDRGVGGKTWGRRRVLVTRGRGGDGRCKDTTHWGVHQEAAYYHSGECGLPPRLYTVHRGGEDAGYEPGGVLVESRRGK